MRDRYRSATFIDKCIMFLSLSLYFSLSLSLCLSVYVLYLVYICRYGSLADVKRICMQRTIQQANTRLGKCPYEQMEIYMDLYGHYKYRYSYRHGYSCTIYNAYTNAFFFSNSKHGLINICSRWICKYGIEPYIYELCVEYIYGHALDRRRI